jgi:thiol:disulfide interchange protein DsbD
MTTPARRALLATAAALWGAISAAALPAATDAPAPGLAWAAANPFRVEVEAPRLTPGAKGVLRVTIVVPPGYHVYRDMMWVKVPASGGLSVGSPSFPPGLQKPDPANPGQNRELYDLNVIVEVPITAPAAAGAHEIELEVGYQGCKGGLCYMPATESVRVPVQVGGGGAGAPAAPQGAAPSWKDPAQALVSAGPGAAAPAADAADFSDLPPSASVQSVDAEGKPHPVHARLLADHLQVPPGGQLRLGLHLTQQKGWHTYWRSPGDIGLPTDIQWSVPTGASTTPYVYPVPHRYDVQGIISYGYEDEVLLFTELRLPDDLPPGQHLLGATAKWLVCEVMCIPGEATLSLPVEVQPGPAVASRHAPRFDQWAAQHPTPAARLADIAVESALSADAVLPEAGFQAAFYLNPVGGKPIEAPQEAGTWPAFVPIVQGSWMVSSVALRPTTEGGLIALVTGETFSADAGALPAGDLVGGLFQVKVGGEWVRTEVTTPLPWAAAGTSPVASTSPLFALAAGAPVAAAGAAPGADLAPPSADSAPAESPLLMLLMAFVGGAILNVMPCVLPVLTIKLYGLVEQQGITPKGRRSAGLAYGAGVVASFLVLAIALVVLRTVFDLPVGWGFQFQYPGYVAALATIVFAFGLSLFGVFEVPAVGANQAADVAAREGLAGHFFGGVFTTLLATPCSAPFLGTGMGFAFSLPTAGVILFFAVAGLGLASPFLLIAFSPALMRFLPRPGAWMETFKQLMGFTLIATTVWLVDVYGGLTGPDGVTGLLAFLTAVGLGAWAMGRYGGPIEAVSRQLGVFGAAVVLSGGAGWRFLSFEVPEDAACGPTATVGAAELRFDAGVPWQPFTEARVDELAGQPVFIDFTADWCLTCKVNERTVLETEVVRSGMAAHGVVPLKADWTRRDAVISKWLERYGRAGVPFYLVVPADRTQAPIPLGEVITPEGVVEALARARGPA